MLRMAVHLVQVIHQLPLRLQDWRATQGVQDVPLAIVVVSVLLDESGRLLPMRYHIPRLVPQQLLVLCVRAWRPVTTTNRTAVRIIAAQTGIGAQGHLVRVVHDRIEQPVGHPFRLRHEVPLPLGGVALFSAQDVQHPAVVLVVEVLSDPLLEALEVAFATRSQVNQVWKELPLRDEVVLREGRIVQPRRGPHNSIDIGVARAEQLQQLPSIFV
mmetsp:Transcript_131873/g.381412  ORF Transcript_131873/g.381412 Transcript_131873/m.381412 type:complete len:214 (+) Transcript_131873:261-902(+)